MWTKEDYIPFTASANYSKHSRLNHCSMTSIKLLFIHFFLIVFISASWNYNIRYKPTYKPLMLNLMIPQPSKNCGKPVLNNYGKEQFLNLFSIAEKNPMLQITICYLTRHKLFDIIAIKFWNIHEWTCQTTWVFRDYQSLQNLLFKRTNSTMIEITPRFWWFTIQYQIQAQ